MSDLNPPSQNKPGLLPSRARTATVLSGNESTVTDARQASFMVAWTGTSGAAILVRKTLANARGNRYRCLGKVHRCKASCLEITRSCRVCRHPQHLPPGRMLVQIMLLATGRPAPLSLHTLYLSLSPS